QQAGNRPGTLALRAQAGLVALEALHVVVRVGIDFPDFLGGEGAHDTPGGAQDERAVRNILALTDQRIRAYQAVSPDPRPVEYHAPDADKAPIADLAAVQHRHVPDADSFAYRHRYAGVHVHDTAVLELRVLADGDGGIVAAHHAVEPDADIG